MTPKETEILQFLLGETRIDVEGGYYVLDVQDEGDEICVTVDYERTERNGDLHPIGRHCVFNEVYSADSYRRKPFSFECLSHDLHEQELEAVDEWFVRFAASKGWEPRD
mgnify:CR=1 FL=1